MSKSVVNNNLKGSLLVLISAVMFGSYGLFSRYLGSYDIFYQTFVRCTLVTLCFITYGLYKHQFTPIAKADRKWFVVILIITNFTIAPIVYAFQHLAIGTASFLFYASFTIFTYILGIIFFKEKMDIYKISSLVLSLFGMLLLFSINFSWVLLLPMLLTVLNGIASGGEVTFSKKISSNYSNAQINAFVFGSIAVTHFVLSFVLGENMDVRLFTESLPVLLVFVLAAIIGMATVVAGFKYVEPSIGAIVGLMEIVVSVILGYFLLNETLSAHAQLGGGLILVAALIPNIPGLMRIRKNYK